MIGMLIVGVSLLCVSISYPPLMQIIYSMKYKIHFGTFWTRILSICTDNYIKGMVLTVSKCLFRFLLPKTSTGSLVLMEGWGLPLVNMILLIIMLKAVYLQQTYGSKLVYFMGYRNGWFFYDGYNGLPRGYQTCLCLRECVRNCWCGTLHGLRCR